MFRSTRLLFAFVSFAMFIGLSTPVLAGPTPTPATPTAAPTAAPAPATPSPKVCGEEGDSCHQGFECCSELALVCSGTGANSICATPATPTPIPTPATPTAAPTPATPTPPPTGDCLIDNPITTVDTIGKTNPQARNQFVRHAITGHIIDPESYTPKAHRIRVCKGSFVSAVITFGAGKVCATNTALGTLECGQKDQEPEEDCNLCEGFVDSREVYTSVSPGGGDTDRIQIVPK